ncbi:hypothetical protein BZM27_12790 [Paraburkholderia steynii]|uniref:Uncharacterized protein n=1 Tax=Paraburkholderia steynii TaxID=1245441 RepID=A0A4R0XLT1_9BURK|nr:hypothetical protein BZM27_12790 [Paraburkholderia steynii]
MKSPAPFGNSVSVCGGCTASAEAERANHRGQRAAHVERGQRGTDGLFVNSEWQGGHHRNHLLRRRVMRQLQFLSDRRSDRNVDL